MPLTLALQHHCLEDSYTHAPKTKGAPHARVTCKAAAMVVIAAVKCAELSPKPLYELWLADLVVSTMMGSPRDSSIAGARVTRKAHNQEGEEMQ